MICSKCGSLMELEADVSERSDVHCEDLHFDAKWVVMTHFICHYCGEVSFVNNIEPIKRVSKHE